MFQSLENRLLLATSVSDGVLLVRGTKGADVIEIHSVSDLTGRTVLVTDNGTVTVWSSPKHFGPHGPHKVLIRGYRGNDRIRFVTSPFAGIRPVRIYGGSGDDVITVDGPRQVARVFGGAGNDVITAYPGNGDTLDGGAGDDVIQTHTPNLNPRDPGYVARLAKPTGFEGRRGSVLVGGAGDDTLVGSIFDDRLMGGAGQDALFGDEGDDTLSGAADNDCYLNAIADACTVKKK